MPSLHRAYFLVHNLIVSRQRPHNDLGAQGLSQLNLRILAVEAG